VGSVISFFRGALFVLLLISSLWADEAQKGIPILCYHRFGDQVNDEMTIKNSTFKKQLAWLKDHNYTVIPLERAVNYLKKLEITIPEKSVVITVDDGHRSVYTDMEPIVREYQIPVTLFIYPSAISNAKYAMTWEQLRELEATNLFVVQSHTYWHPNFKKEKKRLPKEEYDRFVTLQLGDAIKKLETKTGHKVEYLAWAFGVVDDDLKMRAGELGYSAAFTIERRYATQADSMMLLPRFMIVEQFGVKVFEDIVSGRAKR
jgi:peptidoglycan/xylan/chitin deacetylase (PgdA/CDA1 family)